MARQKWLNFDPYIKMDEAWMRDKRPWPCNCPITLVLHDFCLQSSHFNLLVPEEDCCSAPKAENAKEVFY